MRTSSAEALKALLPALKSEHYGTFSSRNILNLSQAMGSSDLVLTTRILDALDKVGTSHAITNVEHLCKTTASVQLRERARSVLETLVERQRRELEGKELLRAAGSSSDPEALLRPAQTDPDSEFQQLLRPTGDNSS